VNQKRFASVYHAAREIQSSVSVGLSYIDYRALLQKYATEVNIAQDAPQNDVEKAMVTYYARALKGYESAGELWATAVKTGGIDKELTGPLMQSRWHSADACVTLANSMYLGHSPGKNDRSKPTCTD
jgi:hypothetical protein